MSRTYRRKSGDQSWLDCALTDYVYYDDHTGTRRYWGFHQRIKIDPRSPEGRKIVAKYRSDKGKPYKEPGPSWFHRLYVQRPYRRRANEEIRHAMLDDEYEPMIETKPHRPWWT